MATLILSTTARSTTTAPGTIASNTIGLTSRPRLTMPLSRALETIVASGAHKASSHHYAASTTSALTCADAGCNHKSATNDDIALLDSRKSCGVVDDRGAGMSRQDAFVISLGSRPPSPPLL